MNLEQLKRENKSRQIIDHAIAHADQVRAQEVDENSTREAFTYGLNHPERLLFPDQDSMNAVLWQRRLKLHPRWNFQLLFRRFDFRTEELTSQLVDEASSAPAIRHFEGPGHSKPWHPDAEPEDRALYWSYRSQTPWASLGPQSPG
jgi:lipopolysaccharide biosynthesis glycosyltransferase